jgi:hypothetical protein
VVEVEGEVLALLGGSEVDPDIVLVPTALAVADSECE